jgi:hypothetical protein
MTALWLPARSGPDARASLPGPQFKVAMQGSPVIGPTAPNAGRPGDPLRPGVGWVWRSGRRRHGVPKDTREWSPS